MRSSGWISKNSAGISKNAGSACNRLLPVPVPPRRLLGIRGRRRGRHGHRAEPPRLPRGRRVGRGRLVVVGNCSACCACANDGDDVGRAGRQPARRAAVPRRRWWRRRCCRAAARCVLRQVGWRRDGRGMWWALVRRAACRGVRHAPRPRVEWGSFDVGVGWAGAHGEGPERTPILHPAAAGAECSAEDALRGGLHLRLPS